MVEVVAEKGYARTVVTDVVQRAGVARGAFYAHFTDIEDCFLAAYEWKASALLTAIRPPDGEPSHRVDALLDAYLAGIAADPAGARVFLIDVYGAGPRALARRYAVLARFVDLAAEVLSDVPGWPADARARRPHAEALVGAISSMVATRLAGGALERLPEIKPAVMALAGLDG